MCGVGWSAATVAAGTALVALSTILGYAVVPSAVHSIILGEVVLDNETEQMERFLEVPFPLTFSIRLFNVTNSAEVIAGGVPSVQEVGPYVYKLYQQRVLEEDEQGGGGGIGGGDTLRYRLLHQYEFDSEASFPRTEDEHLVITNVPFMSVLQVAEELAPRLMGLLQQDLGGVFGEHTEPHMRVRVGDLIFDGVRLCAAPGLIASVACLLIRDEARGIANLEVQPDGSLLFSLFGYKRDKLSDVYEVSRGGEDPRRLGVLSAWAGRPTLPYWRGGACNQLNGTDTGVFPPFVDRARSLYAFNADICRSVELKYERDTEYEGVPAARFVANEWFLADEEGCFCLNVTSPPPAPRACLHTGAMELYSCVGSYMVLTYPHFLFADPQYSSGVLGVTPDLHSHRIFLDLEPNTGTPLRGAKRAQLNVFMRPVRGIVETARLRTTLTPVFWLEESVLLPEEYVSRLKRELLRPLRAVSVAVPALVAVSAAVLLLGSLLLVRARVHTAAADTANTDGHQPRADKD